MDKPVDKYPIPDELIRRYNGVQDLIEDTEYEKAIDVLESILAEAPDHPRVLVSLAKVYFHMRRPDRPEYLVKSEDILIDAIKCYPDLAIAYSFLGILYMRTGRRKEAVQHAHTAVKLEPRSAEGWNALGFYYAISGNYTKALDYFLVAYTIDPNSRVAAYNVSGTYAKLGKIDAALEYLEHALKSHRLLVFIEKDNDFNALRDLPRYKELIEESKRRFNIK